MCSIWRPRAGGYRRAHIDSELAGAARQEPLCPPNRVSKLRGSAALIYTNDIQLGYAIMAILTVRLTAEEARLLAKRSRVAGMKKATFVRKLIREEPFITAGDVVSDVTHRMGDSRLRVPRK